MQEPRGSPVKLLRGAELSRKNFPRHVADGCRGLQQIKNRIKNQLPLSSFLGGSRVLVAVRALVGYAMSRMSLPGNRVVVIFRVATLLC